VALGDGLAYCRYWYRGRGILRDGPLSGHIGLIGYGRLYARLMSRCTLCGEEANGLAAPATTEIRIAMPDPRHVSATYMFARSPALEGAALRRGEGTRVASDSEAKRCAMQRVATRLLRVGLVKAVRRI
jgi:hypothetical protein